MSRDSARTSQIVVFHDDDADLQWLRDKTVAVIGYGNQGRAQALNLRESGVSVLVAGLGDETTQRAEAEGFRVLPIEGCARHTDVLMLLIPDEVQRRVYQEALAGDLRRGHVLCFAHGYNFHYGLIRPPADVDVVLLAPRMIGAVLREAFQRGQGAPAYIAVGQDHSGEARDLVLALAKGIGCTRAGVVELTFEAETVLDLFLEQTLLPIFTKSMLWAFEILTEAGFDPGVVTLEMYGSGELAEVFQACAQVGFYQQLFRFHSRTAQYGELSRKEYILPEAVRAAMLHGLEEIRSGQFAREWEQEEREGFPRFNPLLAAARRHPINQAEREMASKVQFGASLQRTTVGTAGPG